MRRNSASTFALAFLLAALPAAADPSSMPGLLRDLADEDPAVRAAASREIAHGFDSWTAEDMKLVEKALGDPDPERAAGARRAKRQILHFRRIGVPLAEAWERIGMPEAVEARDRATKSLLDAAANCWKGGGASDRQIGEFVAMIREAGGDPVRSCPFAAISRTRCRPLAGVLAARLEACLDPVDDGRARLILALGYAGDPQYGALLRGYVFSPPDLQVACLRAARLMRATAVAPTLALLSENQSPAQRKLAVESLGTCATEREIPALRRRLMDPVPSVRTAAVWAFRDLGRPEAARWIAPLLRDRERSVVRAAILTYATLASPEEAIRIVSVIGGPARVESYFLGEMIGRMRPAGWKERMVAWLASRDPIRRSVAADALGTGEARDAGPALLPLLADHDSKVRLSALTALVTLDPPGIVDAVAFMATDTDETTRHTLATFIEQTRGPRWSALTSALLADPSPTVLRFALGAATASFDPAHIPLAAKLLDHPEADVRRAAAFFLGRRGGKAEFTMLMKTLENDETAPGVIAALADMGDPEAIPILREIWSGRNRYLQGDAERALAHLGSMQEVEASAKSGDEFWWAIRDRFINLPAQATARIAHEALAMRDKSGFDWFEDAILALDGGRIADWKARDRLDFQGRMQNVATFQNIDLRMAAKVRLLEWGLADEPTARELLGHALKGRYNWRFKNALCIALSARYEPAHARLAFELRPLSKDLVNCADVEAWAASFGVSLDMAGFSTLRTWRAGHHVSLREILEETVDVSQRTVYVEGGKARIVLLEEALLLWEKRLNRK